MKRKAIIIDDEPLVRDDLRDMLAAHKDIEVACEVGTVAEAKKLLAANRFDVVFLDIQLLGGSGFDLVPFINPSAAIIFITAHDEFAVRAFEINALDYLLKPVADDRLAESLKRLMRRQAKQPDTTGKRGSFKPSDSVLIRTDAERLFVRLDRITAIHSIGGNYAAIYLNNREKLLSRKTLKNWETILPKSLFTRIHRSTIINNGFIERINFEKDGSCLVHLSGQKETFAVSRRLLSSLKSAL
jgi:two-component system LytT family response regulator